MGKPTICLGENKGAVYATRIVQFVNHIVGFPTDGLNAYLESAAELNGQKFEPHHEKTNNVVSKQVLHKSSCTSTEDCKRLEILDLKSRGVVLSV